MSRIVLTTQDGDIFDDLEIVGEANIGRQVAAWVHTHPHLPIYIDGKLLADELRCEILEAMAQASTSPSTPGEATPEQAGSITPEEFRTFNQLLGQAATDLRRAQIQMVEQAQSLTAWQLNFCKAFSEMLLERDKHAADEAARQRRMTHQSLRDIDLLDRSITVTEVTEMFQRTNPRGPNAASARMMAPSNGYGPKEWVQALAAVAGMWRPPEAKPEEPK